MAKRVLQVEYLKAIRKREVLISLRHPDVLTQLPVVVFVFFFVNFEVYEILREFLELLHLALADRLVHLSIPFETVSEELSAVQFVQRPAFRKRKEQSGTHNNEYNELKVIGLD